MIEELRIKAKEAFADYVAPYDIKDPKIELKIVHTYKVADLCERIARDLKLTEEDIAIAWMCGLLHDVGRFEQVRRYNTFIDADSVDHAHLSTEILFGENGVVRDFYSEEEWDSYIRTAVYNHSAYRIEEGLDDRHRTFCNILRDADKIDIYRVQLDTPLTDIYNTTEDELYNADISPEVEKAFYEHHAVLRALRKTTVDSVVGHLALYWELVYPVSREIVQAEGYLKKLAYFPSSNPLTLEKFEGMRKEIGLE